MAKNFARFLIGSDLRKLRGANRVVREVRTSSEFRQLFRLIFRNERHLAMRAADAVEKITRKRPGFLAPYKQQLLELMYSRTQRELRWHLAQLIPRLSLSNNEMASAWKIFTYQALNPNESKIVRVNSMQALYDLFKMNSRYHDDFMAMVGALESDRSASIQARLRKIKVALGMVESETRSKSSDTAHDRSF